MNYNLTLYISKSRNQNSICHAPNDQCDMVFEFGCYKLYSFNIANFKNKLVTCTYIVSVSFIWGTESTRRRSHTFCKWLTNLVTLECFEYNSNSTRRLFCILRQIDDVHILLKRICDNTHFYYSTLCFSYNICFNNIELRIKCNWIFCLKSTRYLFILLNQLTEKIM